MLERSVQGIGSNGVDLKGELVSSRTTLHEGGSETQHTEKCQRKLRCAARICCGSCDVEAVCNRSSAVCDDLDRGGGQDQDVTRETRVDGHHTLNQASLLPVCEPKDVTKLQSGEAQEMTMRYASVRLPRVCTCGGVLVKEPSEAT